MALIPETTNILVVGGGPGGSYAASALAREGLDVVLLEGDKFPRYHIGESMLASMRHFLRFIDLDSTFDSHGFIKKRGAAFKLNDKPEGFTDFIAAGGPGNYAWNVVRSEADHLMFQHAGKSGAKIFDQVRVSSLEFTNSDMNLPDPETPNPGRPIAALWNHKTDGSSGTIKFDYLVDASGRFGLMSTKYLKNRKFNQGLKNIANWSYWKNAGTYAEGTQREGQPFFEALSDASGWCWLIPLHNGTTSVGVVQNQDMATAKKKEMGSPSQEEFYKASLKLVPKIEAILSKAELTAPVKQASDWSYNASCYAAPNVRIVGDAGCFIDPYFSSGVHLALSGAMSAAVTIRAAQKGECDEQTAMSWHSKKVAEGYTRFLLVVLSAMKQIRKSDEPVLSDWDENGFERAFSFFRPIIQGTADVGGKLTQNELSKTIDFCLNAFQHTAPEERDAVIKKIEAQESEAKKESDLEAKAQVDPDGLSPEEMKVLKTIRARQMLRTEDVINIDSFGTDTIDGFAPRIKRGELGLKKPEKWSDGPAAPKMDLFAKAKEDHEQPAQQSMQHQAPAMVKIQG